MTTRIQSGTYATGTEVYHVTETGRVWVVASPDFDGPAREIDPADMPEDATPLGDADAADIDLSGVAD